MSEIRYVRVGIMTRDGKEAYRMYAIKSPVNPYSLLYAEQKIVFDWCMDQFGPPTPQRWRKSGSMLGFRNEEDALVFKMRWS